MAKPITDYVPFYRDATRAWGAVNRILAITCAVPTAVYVDAAVKGAWHFAYNIISPDPKEIYHQLIGNSLYHDIKAGAEGTGVVPPRSESNITKGLFLIADTVDVALWYGFIFGSAVDGLVDFSTQLQKYSGCEEKRSPKFFQGGPYINAISDDGTYDACVFAGNLGDGRPIAQPATYTTRNNRFGFCAASMAFATFGGAQKVSSDATIICENDGTQVDLGTSAPELEGAQKLGHVFYKNRSETFQSFTYIVRARYSGGVPLPLGEAFRDGDRWYGYSYNIDQN
jgi:hypothetical protein